MPTTVETAVEGNMSVGSGEEVGGPALVGGGGERDEQRRRPGVGGEERAHVGDEDDGAGRRARREHGEACGRR